MLEIREAYPCRRADGQASGAARQGQGRGAAAGQLPPWCLRQRARSIVPGRMLACAAATLAHPLPCEPAPAGTSVELCAESQFEVSCLMEERGQVPVGWYHSHPVFEPRPSQKGEGLGGGAGGAAGPALGRGRTVGVRGRPAPASFPFALRTAAVLTRHARLSTPTTPTPARQREPAQLPGAVPAGRQRAGALGGRHRGAVRPGPGVGGALAGLRSPGPCGCPGWLLRRCSWGRGRRHPFCCRPPASAPSQPPSQPPTTPCSHPRPPPTPWPSSRQSSRIQLWVVRSHHGELRPFNVRATTTGVGELPSDNTEQAIAM